jgi:hypothetical protein
MQNETLRKLAQVFRDSDGYVDIVDHKRDVRAPGREASSDQPGSRAATTPASVANRGSASTEARGAVNPRDDGDVKSKPVVGLQGVPRLTAIADTDPNSVLSLIEAQGNRSSLLPDVDLRPPSAFTEGKLNNETVGLAKMMMNRKKAGKSGKHAKQQVYKCNTCFRSVASGGAGAFYAPVIPLQPNNASVVTEASQFAVLFDEGRCVGFTVHARVEGVNSNGAWAYCYDPANSGPYTSVVGVLLAQQHAGPISYNASTATSSGVVAVNGTGYITKRFRVYGNTPTAGASAVSEAVGNNWFSTSDSSASVGYLKIAADAFTGLTAMSDVMVVYHMEYRSRS